MGAKVDMMRIGLDLLTRFEQIIKEILQIKNEQTHGEQQLISFKEKHFAIYQEIFETESDAEHFINFCNLVYSMQKGQLPPIHILITFFRMMYPIITPKALKGKQGHGKPELRKMENGKFRVILIESFTEKDDAQQHLDEATKIKSMKL